MNRLLRTLATLFLALSFTMAFTACELEGGTNTGDAQDTAVPQTVTISVFNGAFNQNGNPVTQVTISAGGSITFSVPGSAPVANIVILQLTYDEAIDPGQSRTVTFPNAGTFTVTDDNAGGGTPPQLSVIVQ